MKSAQSHIAIVDSSKAVAVTRAESDGSPIYHITARRGGMLTEQVFTEAELDATMAAYRSIPRSTRKFKPDIRTAHFGDLSDVFNRLCRAEVAGDLPEPKASELTSSDDDDEVVIMHSGRYVESFTVEHQNDTFRSDQSFVWKLTDEAGDANVYSRKEARELIARAAKHHPAGVWGTGYTIVLEDDAEDIEPAKPIHPNDVVRVKNALGNYVGSFSTPPLASWQNATYAQANSEHDALLLTRKEAEAHIARLEDHNAGRLNVGASLGLVIETVEHRTTDKSEMVVIRSKAPTDDKQYVRTFIYQGWLLTYLTQDALKMTRGEAEEKIARLRNPESAEIIPVADLPAEEKETDVVVLKTMTGAWVRSFVTYGGAIMFYNGTGRRHEAARFTRKSAKELVAKLPTKGASITFELAA
jgi:hypothetical protein